MNKLAATVCIKFYEQTYEMKWKRVKKSNIESEGRNEREKKDEKKAETNEFIMQIGIATNALNSFFRRGI